MTTSSIAWLANPDGSQGKTWNPVSGCDWASRGCDNCYARPMAKRLKGMELKLVDLGRLDPTRAKYQSDGDPRTSGPGFGVAMHPHTLKIPLGWRKPQRVFVNSMSDLFHPQVTTEFIAKVFAVMALTPRHTYKILTKRPQRMPALLGDVTWQELVSDEVAALAAKVGVPVSEDLPSILDRPLPNVWIGVSVEDQHQADRRIPDLLDSRVAVRWISAEPLLDQVEVMRYLVPDSIACWAPRHVPDQAQKRALAEMLRAAARTLGSGLLDWVVVGGESGPGARPMNLDWARRLRADCELAGVPFFFKQLGSVQASEFGIKGAGEDFDQLPAEFQIRQYPPAHAAAITTAR